MRTMKSVLATLIILVVAGVLFVLSGIYNISARVPHKAVTYRLLEILRDRSVEHYSGDVTLPSLADPELAMKGSIHFDETCRRCHGAPDQLRDEFAQGLYPVPPSLKACATDLSTREIFWVIENGFKMTGMPAFGLNHDKAEIIGMVAFIEKLPDLVPKDYRQFVTDAEARFGGYEHHDGKQTSPDRP